MKTLKRAFIILILLLPVLLCACVSSRSSTSPSPPPPESLPPSPTGGAKPQDEPVEDKPMLIVCAVPSDALLTAGPGQGGGGIYENPGGDYRLTVQTIANTLGADGKAYLYDAMEELGAPEGIEISEGINCGLPEFACDWESDTSVCRARLIDGGDYFYYVSFFVKTEAAEQYEKAIEQMLLSFGVLYDEGI